MHLARGKSYSGFMPESAKSGDLAGSVTSTEQKIEPLRRLEPAIGRILAQQISAFAGVPGFSEDNKKPFFLSQLGPVEMIVDQLGGLGV